MFHHESRKPIYFGGQSSKFKAMSDKTGVGVDVCTLVSAGCF